MCRRRPRRTKFNCHGVAIDRMGRYGSHQQRFLAYLVWRDSTLDARAPCRKSRSGYDLVTVVLRMRSIGHSARRQNVLLSRKMRANSLQIEWHRAVDCENRDVHRSHAGSEARILLIYRQITLVARGGIEPPTRGFSGHRRNTSPLISTACAHRPRAEVSGVDRK